MAFHDDYLRRTPYELAFPDADGARALAAEIESEARERRTDVGDPQAFVMLATVGAFLRELRGPQAAPDAIQQYAALVFHAYHFLRAGAPTTLVDTHVARYLVGGAPGGAPGGALTMSAGAGYVQLPRHLFWIQASPESAAEGIDGLFWTASGDVVHVLLAVGIHEGRPGLGVVPLPPAPIADAGAWLDARIRDGGDDDFATTLPGGDLEGLYSIVAAGEVLKLLARIFAYREHVPRGVVAGPRPPDGASPRPSALPYDRLVLID